jgi:hypothetical protein
MASPDDQHLPPELAPGAQYYELLAEPVTTNPRDRAAWQARRAAIRAALRDRLGLNVAPERLPLQPRQTPVPAPQGCELARIAFQAWPGVEATGWLARPAGEGERHPTLLCPPGLPRGQRVHQDVRAGGLLPLAQRGFVVLMLDGLELERPELGLSTAGVLVWNHLRALDYLLARPDVAREQLGVFGYGPGADLSALLLAVDDRPVAAALGTDARYFRDRLRTGDAPQPAVTPPGLLRVADAPELLGCFAPRPLLLLTLSEPPEESARALGELRNLYGLYFLENRLEVERLPDPMPALAPQGQAGDWFTRVFATSATGPPPGGPELPITWPPARLDVGAPETAPIVEHYLARAAAQPPRLESRAARKNYQIRLRADLQQLLADPIAETVLDPMEESAGPDEAPARLSFRSEPGARVAADLWLPAATPAPAVVLCAAGAGSAERAEELATTCRAAGFVVLRLHSRLALAEVADWEPLLRLSGRAPAAMAARDLRAAVDYLVRRPEVDRRRLALVGDGAAGVAAILAAGWDDRVSAVAADAGGTTYRDGGAGLPWLPAILTLADVPQLASLAAPRPLWLYHVPPERAGFSSRRYFDWTRRTYQSFAAENALRMDPSPAPSPAALAEWLRAQFRKR